MTDATRRPSVTAPGQAAWLGEVRLVWLAAPEQFTYLRESTYTTTRPRGPIARRFAGDGGRIVGYAEKAADGSGMYVRRVWWLKSYDRDLDPTGVYARRHGVYPHEAVRPSSIRLGRPSDGPFFLRED